MRNGFGILCLGMMLCLSGCSIEEIGDTYLGSGTPKYEEPEYQKKQDVTWRNVPDYENLSGYSMDDSFVNKYLDPDDMEHMKKKVEESIKDVSIASGFTQKEADLAKEMMEKEILSAPTEKDLHSQREILEEALSGLSENAKKSQEEYLSDFHMTEEDFSKFVEKLLPEETDSSEEDSSEKTDALEKGGEIDHE